jgi:hypothetical protein
MSLIGVTLTALAILYLFTTLVLGVTGNGRHPIIVSVALIIMLALGLLLMAE